jgi:Flp pilus assembly CpaF family ATPase
LATHVTRRTTGSQARRTNALASALGPIQSFLADDRVVENLVSADGCVWVEKLGEGMLRTLVRMRPGSGFIWSRTTGCRSSLA